MTTQKYRKSNKFSKTRSKKGGVKTRSGTDTSKVNKTNTRVIKKTNTRVIKKTNTRVIKKTKQVKEEELCPICLEELQKTDNIPKLPCKHKFHKHCLMPLCSSKNNRDVPCPICRGDITNSCISDINPPPPTRPYYPPGSPDYPPPPVSPPYDPNSSPQYDPNRGSPDYPPPPVSPPYDPNMGDKKRKNRKTKRKSKKSKRKT